MDKNVLQEINHTGFDVLIIFNYSNIELKLPDLTEYSEIIVIAWSMGVWAAEVANIKPSMAIAINGTPNPLCSSHGIGTATISATINNWSDAAQSKFNMRMMGGAAAMEAQKHLLPKRAIANQKSELQAIAALSANHKQSLKWDKAIIGTSDKIFSTANQQKYWAESTKTTILDIPHWPFSRFKEWKSIIEL